MEVAVRRATEADAEALYVLNGKFNGTGCTSFALLEGSLAENTQEAVFIALVDDTPAGFCCVQVFRSMCYDRHYAEVTELFVDEKFRQQGVASALMKWVEEHFSSQNMAGFQLFTGRDNFTAQMFYEKLGYKKTQEIMYRKRGIKHQKLNIPTP